MVEEIRPKEAKERILSGAAICLDVRTKEEIEESNTGHFVWIELSVLAERYAELPKNKEIICLCRSGKRSLAAAEFLCKKGFRAKNLHGGIIAWEREFGK
ncbi:MAG TPA: rhodanese-like domain-containing protein [Candidatus Diapherotrites archaeon]|uniref:Rhodanese-like domain-containing protein n=1 Tax=Candidatus Iainarchaeum sp. TaxID=3101447 RepID=A0A7J4IW91_9ARCH|nr:rhodanese-like domain-containing protein [Candidatus Diapherotrites archaeon]